MPQIADLEIAATWDEIELEAALKVCSAEAQDESSAQTPSALAEALRAVEELKRLPKEERKRRAEELLRALTSPTPEPEIAPASAEPPPVDASPNVEPEAVAVDAPPPVEAAPTPEPQPTAPPAETSEQRVEEVPIAAPAPLADTAANAPETAEPVVAEPVAAETAEEPSANAQPASAADAPAVADPAPEAEVGTQAIAEPVAQVASEPMPEVASEPATAAAVATQPTTDPVMATASDLDAIPKFLTTECAALEPEQPDSLIPLRAAAAAGALIGAVLLIYFGSSQEFGLAARPIVGAREIVQGPVVAPRMSTSLAVRQAFVALPPDFATGPTPVRPRRPALVGFDFFDDAAPAAAIAVTADAVAVPPEAAPVARQASSEETAALPPAPSSDVAALIKRGDDLLKAGDIAAARSAFERAAAQGNAKAEIGVGMTYDPLVLSKLGARGVRGDPVQAASWYARAGEAGDEEGQQRLHALISGLSDCMLSQGTCANRKP